MNGGYHQYDDYLRDELSRVAYLVEAYALRQAALAPSETSAIQKIMQCPFTLDDSLDGTEHGAHCQHRLDAAKALKLQIVNRLRATALQIRREFPLYRLARVFDLYRPIVWQMSKPT